MNERFCTKVSENESANSVPEQLFEFVDVSSLQPGSRVVVFKEGSRLIPARLVSTPDFYSVSTYCAPESSLKRIPFGVPHLRRDYWKRPFSLTKGQRVATVHKCFYYEAEIVEDSQTDNSTAKAILIDKILSRSIKYSGKGLFRFYTENLIPGVPYEYCEPYEHRYPHGEIDWIHWNYFQCFGVTNNEVDGVAIVLKEEVIIVNSKEEIVTPYSSKLELGDVRSILFGSDVFLQGEKVKVLDSEEVNGVYVVGSMSRPEVTAQAEAHFLVSTLIKNPDKIVDQEVECMVNMRLACRDVNGNIYEKVIHSGDRYRVTDVEDGWLKIVAQNEVFYLDPALVKMVA